MKLHPVLTGLFAVIALLPCHRLTGAAPAQGLPAQYIVINRDSFAPWDVGKPDSFQREQFDEIHRALPTGQGSRVRVGVSYFFSYLLSTNDAPLAESLRRFLALATQTDTPVCVALDGEYWWQGRPDLWNWWDTNRPGFNPANRENVEWSSWSSDDALKISWLNWGRQIRMLPPPNLLSPRYRQACREKFRLLVPIIVDWWRALPPEKKDLFVGLKVSWESAIGVNGYYYTNGNALLDQPEAGDPKSGIRGQIVPSRGAAQIGYAAVKTGGIRSSGEITEADLAEVVRRHVEDYSREAAQLGLPRERIFTHVGGWKEGERLFDSAVNRFASPGWSFYGRAIDPASGGGVQRALKSSDAACWAAAEWLHQGTNTMEAWRGALARTLTDPRCRFLNIFNWSGIRNNTNALAAIGSLASDSGPPGPMPPPPPRLKRAESFLGIHFDFHAGPDCTEIGKNTTPAMVENIIDLVHPDYLQIDCKGHRGLSSYPTRVGHPAPGFVGDPLRIWREVTARRGVSLFLHYSGVWDNEALLRHPDWAAINADGQPNPNATSLFSPYADRLLVPQLGELASEYGVDGAWIDGECWAAVPDYGPAALQAFRTATGIDDVPRKPGQAHWFEFLQFNREAFGNYLRHYTAQMKLRHPQFELCSNWAFTDHMAQPVSAPVDFLSGDYSPSDSVNSARLSGRFLVHQGKPWDLMAWSFARRDDREGWRQKSAVQLQREAAVVVALGGGFQAYFQQTRDGAIREEQMPVMAEVARFCRARQAICHHAQPVPQIALLLSTAGHFRKLNGLFNRDLANVSGTLQALLETQNSVEVVSEHQLAGRMAEYPLIVVPEWDWLEPEFRAGLTAYVKGGGNLLLVGPRTAALFAQELNVALPGEPVAAGSLRLAHRDELVPLKGSVQSATLGAQARAWGQIRSADSLGARWPAASLARLGQGKIAAVYFNFAGSYLAGRRPEIGGFLNELVRELFPNPVVEVRGSAEVDVMVNRLGGRLAVNLVNTAGPHADPRTPVFDAIPPVGPLQIGIRTQHRPQRVSLEPGGQVLAFEYSKGRTRLTLPSLAIHEVIVVE